MRATTPLKTQVEWGPCDVLLINPPWVSKEDNIWNGIKAAMPPLSLLSLAAYLLEKGVKVRVLDVHVEMLRAADVAERIRQAQPKWVGLTVMTATSVPAHKIARVVKREVPGCKVVFGGVHAEAMPAESLSNSAVDYVVRGDGEETLHAMATGTDPRTLNGVSWRKVDMVINNPPTDVEMNLDSRPMPAYHLVPMHLYYPAIGAYKRLPAINMLMTRGCPGKCTFCNSANTTLRSRSADHVVKEIEYLRDTFGVREIQFYDDTFTVSKKNVLRFCELMVERKVDVAWSAFVRADCFSEEMAKAMKKAGCHQLLIGIESGDEQILRNVRKPINKERNRKTVEIARAHGIESRCAYIFGSMGESIETMKATLRESIELDPDLAIYNINTPYPGTQLFEWAKANGYMATEEWSEFELSTFLLKLPGLSGDDVFKFYAHAHRTFYMRPSAIWRRLKQLRSRSHLRDVVHAFFYIVLRRKLGRRGEVRSDWLGHKKTDFFDLTLRENRSIPKLTFELRQKDVVDRDAWGSVAHRVEQTTTP